MLYGFIKEHATFTRSGFISHFVEETGMKRKRTGTNLCASILAMFLSPLFFLIAFFFYWKIRKKGETRSIRRERFESWNMPLLEKDFLALIPVFAIALLYWVKDRYMFNRANEKWWKVTPTQMNILLTGYPVWIFLKWILGVQTSRVDVLPSLVTTLANEIVVHYVVVGTLNDSFLFTKQQLISFLLGILISYSRTAFYLLITPLNGQCVCDVVQNNESHNCFPNGMNSSAS